MMHSPRLGVVRDSMVANPRLFRPPLGRSRSLPLPRLVPDFVYGMKTTDDDGVAEALSQWRVQPTVQGSARLQPLQVDHMYLNREGVKSGLVTAKQLNQHRAQWARGNHHHHHHTHNQSRLTTRTSGVPDITFGITTRPPSPLSDLLAHQYGQRWLDEKQRQPTAPPDQAKLCISDTRTSLLRRSRPLPKPEPQCTIRRFIKVSPALDTFRDPENRLKAFRAQRSDCVSRRGTFGQGTYNLD